MKKRVPKAFLAIVFLFIFLPDLTGQEVVSPFISHLKYDLRENQLILSWKDNPDMPEAKNIVYRHTEELTDKNYTSAEIVGEIAAGKESFTDTPPLGINLYYAVVIKDKEGTVYNIFIPFRNKTTVPILVTVPKGEIGMASVSGIKARVDEDASVVITFFSSLKNKTLNIYSSTKPILSSSSLLSATRLSSFPSSQTKYIDFPLPGVPYYYAVIDSDLLKTSSFSLTLGSNSTKVPIELPLEVLGIKDLSGFQSRGKPLPFFNITSSIRDGAAIASSPFHLVQPYPLSEKTAREADSLLIYYKPALKSGMEQIILPIHKSDSLKEEDLYLKELVESTFNDRNWEEAETELKEFLRVKRNRDVEASARFYLGQSFYFQGRLREAFLEFLLADTLREETLPWIDRILEDLAYQNREETR